MKFQRPPWLAIAIVGAIALASGTAMGRGEERPVVVWGEGAHADELASRVASHVSTPYVVGGAGAFRRALASTRAPSLAAAAKDPGIDAKLVAGARIAARSAHVDVAVLLYARRSKRATVVHVWLVDPKGEGSAEADVEVAFAAGTSAEAEADAAWNAVAQELPGQSAPAPPPASVESSATVPAGPATSAMPADGDHGTPEIESTAEQGEPTRSTALASIGAGIQGGARDFSYVDRITPTLRPYNLVAAPLVFVDAELYPLARSRTPVLKDFGATFDYARAIGLASTDSAGTSVGTTWNAFDLGARERFPIGHAVLAGIHGGYGEIDYSFHGALRTSAQLPDVQYRFLRGGLDARVALGAVSVYGHASYLGVVSTGLFGTYFARASVGGIEARIGVAHTIARGFELSLEIAYTRFYYSLHPQPGDAYVAGGALDQIARGSLGVAYLF